MKKPLEQAAELFRENQAMAGEDTDSIVLGYQPRGNGCGFSGWDRHMAALRSQRRVSSHKQPEQFDYLQSRALRYVKYRERQTPIAICRNNP